MVLECCLGMAACMVDPDGCHSNNRRMHQTRQHCCCSCPYPGRQLQCIPLMSNSALLAWVDCSGSLLQLLQVICMWLWDCVPALANTQSIPPYSCRHLPGQAPQHQHSIRMDSYNAIIIWFNAPRACSHHVKAPAC